jgi:short subunit dehydrogenase-like uncharacterized protein
VTSPDDARELDLVLHGATGFVGRLTAGYLAEHAPSGVRIALSGRSPERLHEVRNGLGPAAAGWPVLVADSASTEDLVALAARTRVVASTVGPYARHGLPLVAACARAGTHYADLTGEVLFVRESIDRFDRTARGTGARVVHACGFDSVPSDLAVMLLHRAASADDAGPLTATTLSAHLRGGVSGGTLDSVRGQLAAMRRDAGARRIVLDPYALSPDRTREPDLGRQHDLARIGFDPDLGEWVGPFVMAPFNTRVVRRSNALQGWAYGRELRYREVLGFGRGPASPVLAAAATGTLAALAAGLAAPGARQLLGRLLPSAGEGPSAATRESGWFRMQAVTATSGGARYVATVSGRGDPGYAATSVLLGESALALALDDLPPVREERSSGGVLTPATAIGEALVDRLRRAGMELTARPAEPA